MRISRLPLNRMVAQGHDAAGRPHLAVIARLSDAQKTSILIGMNVTHPDILRDEITREKRNVPNVPRRRPV